MTGAGRTALVTGAAGQDGVLLSRLLRDKGYRVVGLLAPGSSLTADTAALLDGVRLVEADLRDRQALAEVLTADPPDEVYNLAGISSVAASWRDPVTVTEVNAVAVLGVLELLRGLQGDVRFLQAGSGEMFGLPESAPQDEATPLAPRNPYAVAKTYAHQLTTTYRAGFGLHASNVILFNHESTLRDKAFVTRKITSTVADIHLGRAQELRLGDMDVRRDWGAATDYVRAMWLAVQRDEPDDYVIATGTAYSVRDVVDIAFSHVGRHDWASLVHSDAGLIRPTDSPLLVGDASKARRLLGWEPTTDFPSVIRAMVDHDLALAGS